MFYEIPLQDDREKNLFCRLCPDKYQCRLDPKPFSISNWTQHFFSFYFKNVRYKEECNKHQWAHYAVLANVNILGQGTLKLLPPNIHIKHIKHLPPNTHAHAHACTSHCSYSGVNFSSDFIFYMQVYTYINTHTWLF